MFNHLYQCTKKASTTTLLAGYKALRARYVVVIRVNLVLLIPAVNAGKVTVATGVLKADALLTYEFKNFTINGNYFLTGKVLIKDL